jgi:hypothetical protein
MSGTTPSTVTPPRRSNTLPYLTESPDHVSVYNGESTPSSGGSAIITPTSTSPLSISPPSSLLSTSLKNMETTWDSHEKSQAVGMKISITG